MGNGFLSIISLLWALLPLAVASAYFIVYRRAGLSGAVLIFCAIPAVLFIAKVAVFSGIGATGFGKAILLVIWWFESLIYVLPLFILAVAGRPRASYEVDASS